MIRGLFFIVFCIAVIIIDFFIVYYCVLQIRINHMVSFHNGLIKYLERLQELKDKED